jgi:hypothetical protein
MIVTLCFNDFAVNSLMNKLRESLAEFIFSPARLWGANATLLLHCIPSQKFERQGKFHVTIFCEKEHPKAEFLFFLRRRLGRDAKVLCKCNSEKCDIGSKDPVCVTNNCKPEDKLFLLPTGS